MWSQKIKILAYKVKKLLRLALRKIGIIHHPPLCENSVLWASSEGTPILKIHPDFTIPGPLPECIVTNSFLNVRFEIVNGLGYPGQHLVCFKNVDILGHREMIRIRNGAFLTETHWRVANVINHPFYLGDWPIHKKRHIEGDHFCIMGRNGSQYYHWTWDELPRLLSALPHLPENTTFLVAEDLSEYQLETFRILGISEERLLRNGAFEQTTVERLWFATPLGHSEHATTSPVISALLKQRFADYFGICVASEPTRRLFVSRKLARRRKLENESEILDLVKLRGFETVYPEEMTLREQVLCFSQAAVILAQHGAALVNMLHAQPGCKIIEMHGPEVTRVHYYSMSKVLQHHYDCLVGQPARNPGNPYEPDFVVNPQELHMVLDRNLG